MTEDPRRHFAVARRRRLLARILAQTPRADLVLVHPNPGARLDEAPAHALHLKALREQKVARGLVDGGKERLIQRGQGRVFLS